MSAYDGGSRENAEKHASPQRGDTQVFKIAHHVSIKAIRIWSLLCENGMFALLPHKPCCHKQAARKLHLLKYAAYQILTDEFNVFLKRVDE